MSCPQYASALRYVKRPKPNAVLTISDGVRSGSHYLTSLIGNMSDLPAMLRAARDTGGFTNRDLAEKIGRDESTVSLWMSGKRTPRMKNLQELARAMGVEMAELWSGPEAVPVTAAQAAVLEEMSHLDETQQEAIAALVRSMRSRNP